MDLPADLELPLASGAPWWYWLGGRPALDFVNTFRERWWRQVETLVTPGDLAAWCVQAKLLAQPVNVGEERLREARQLREAINAGVAALLDRRAVPTSTVTEINAWLPLGVAHLQLINDADGTLVLEEAPPHDGLGHALALIAEDAAGLFGTEERARLRICASDTCSARFFDASRAGTRRWCSMRYCGNAAKARRHRERSLSS